VINPNYVAAISALAGATIGGLTTFLSTWVGQRAQTRAQFLLNDKTHRQDLYRDFVNQSCDLYIDSLTSQKPSFAKLVGLYALISRMRIISSMDVSEEAKCVAQMIFTSYAEPNKDLGDLQDMVRQDKFDPMSRFSELCRAELERLR